MKTNITPTSPPAPTPTLQQYQNALRSTLEALAGISELASGAASSGPFSLSIAQIATTGIIKANQDLGYLPHDLSHRTS